jgi:hypothetical protein
VSLGLLASTPAGLQLTLARRYLATRDARATWTPDALFEAVATPDAGASLRPWAAAALGAVLQRKAKAAACTPGGGGAQADAGAAKKSRK